jgi:hypothetical protein
MLLKSAALIPRASGHNTSESAGLMPFNGKRSQS